MGAIKAFFSANAVKLLGVAVSALSVVGVLLGARKSGRDAERVDSLKKTSKHVEQAHEVENKNARLPDGGAADRLRDRWSRD